MLYFVNFLSAFRIAAAFLIIPTLMFQMYWIAFILFALAAISDFFDGYLARKYDVCTKLGGVLDQIADKLLVVNSLILLAIMMPVWFVIIPVILMVSREIYISGLREFLGTQKIEMPVPKARFSMGKIKTTLQLVSIGILLLMFALGSMEFIGASENYFMKFVYAMPLIGIYGLWLSLVASFWSAAEYTISFAKKYKSIKK